MLNSIKIWHVRRPSVGRDVPTKHYGFGFIEVLVALFIFSFGLLGIAALQTVALQRNYNGLLRSLAISQLMNGYNRIIAGKESRELLLWNQMNKKLLPGGEGVYQDKTVRLCWHIKNMQKNFCITNAAK